MPEQKPPQIVKAISIDDPRWEEVSRVVADDGSILVSWRLFDFEGDATHNRIETIRPKRKASEEIGVWNYFDEE